MKVPSKIYFVMPSPGYWKGLVTTNFELAVEYAKDHPGHKWRECVLSEIDFPITNAKAIGPVGSTDREVRSPEKYLWFIPVYQAAWDSSWAQLVNRADFGLLETVGFQSTDFESDLCGVSMHVKLPFDVVVNEDGTVVRNNIDY